MKTSRVILASMLVGVIAIFALAAKGQQGSAPGDDPKKIRDDVHLRELMLSRQYAEFEDALLKLKQRLERSGSKEDKERAVVLQRVLDEAREKGVGIQFDQLVNHLKNQKPSNLVEIQQAEARAAKLADNLREILALMREDSRAAKLREERLSLEAYLKEINRLIREQQTVQQQTELNKTIMDELKKNQNKVTTETAGLAKKMEGKLGQGGEAKKPGEAKEGGKAGNKGEAKDAGKGGEKGQAKAGQDKDGAKTAEAKGGEKAGEPKAGEPKAGAKTGEPKGGEAKAGKGGEGKAGEPKDGGKGGEAKQGEAKGGEGKGGEAKEGGQKGGDQGAQKGQQNQANPNPKDQVANGKKQVQDANGYQQSAENKIGDKKNDQATEDQGKAIDELNKARKKLEDLLKQLREEELERLLAALQARCERMLAMQIAVYHGTQGLYKVIEATEDKKPRREDQQGSLKLSDNEKDIVVEATKAIEMLEAEGSAVAFPEVFQQVREDMKHVQRRLEFTDVGIVTQAIEKDIIDSLKEMIEALKKAKQDLDNKKSPPSDSQPKNNPDQKLLDQIAELKMIRSLQLRVNARTETYGRMYVPKEGEQTADPAIRRELQQLSERQVRIFEVTNRIAKGDNK